MNSHEMVPLDSQSRAPIHLVEMPLIALEAVPGAKDLEDLEHIPVLPHGVLPSSLAHTFKLEEIRAGGGVAAHGVALVRVERPVAQACALVRQHTLACRVLLSSFACPKQANRSH